MEGIYLSSASYLLLVSLIVLIALAAVKKWTRKGKKYAPGPRPWPILGSLHLLAGYEVPYQAFDHLSKLYGPIFKIRLGQTDSLVVSALDPIKEVLINKGEHFDGRPNFSRYTHIFGGKRDNSLAFCDWSDLQKARKEMIRDHTFPRAMSSKFFQLEAIVNRELEVIIKEMNKGVSNIKPLMLHACGNMFLSYFGGIKFQLGDFEYTEMLKNFDLVFYEVNQGYAADFMPWLIPLHYPNMARTRKWGNKVREFMIENVVKKGGEEGDLLHTLLQNVKNNQMSFDTAMFAFEDIVGGHSAVANLIVKIIGFIAKYPWIQKTMQEEVDAVTCGKTITLQDRQTMPYTEAVILECIRHISSPIVPHVASQDTNLNGYHIDKGTLIFLNNYTLNMSPELWKEPKEFNPERFITDQGGLLKPEHFLPFGGGRRSCMGYKMTQYIAFATLATLMQYYTITPQTDARVPLGDLALPYNPPLKFYLHPRVQKKTTPS
nr:spook [Pyrrhocoris apterus]